MTDNQKIPEFEPPVACVSRIIKSAIPENVQLTKDARAAFTRAAGIFIFYLTHCANEFSHENKRSTIYAADVLNALRELDFEEFIEPLEVFLEAYRKEVASKKSKKAVSSNAEAGDDDDANEEGEVEIEAVENEGVDMVTDEVEEQQT